MDLPEIEAALRAAGLVPRGAFHPTVADGVPPVSGRPTMTVVMVGNAGPDLWQRFSRDRRPEPHPLDAWSERVLRPLAGELGGAAVFPSHRPYLPFQRWAMRADSCQPSPLGLLIHPDYGLWHGYRGALLFSEALDLPAVDRPPSPCAECRDRPCLAACPVGAFTGQGYDVPGCVTHLIGPSGADCCQEGCRARRSCPVGQSYRYAPAQAAFHMAAFIRNHRSTADEQGASNE